MSDAKPHGLDFDREPTVNVDNLLAEVKQMANRVETLIEANGTAESNPSASGPEPAPDGSADSAPRNEPPPPASAEPPLDGAGVDQPAEPTGEGESRLEPTDTGPAEKIADEELAQALNKIQSERTDPKPDLQAPGEPTGDDGPIREFPASAQKILGLLMAVNRPFSWVPRSVKDVLGYAGIATLMFAVLVWIAIYRLKS